ncbi:MAG: PDZ domain-containing protein [Saprospiraceae bacterium]
MQGQPVAITRYKDVGLRYFDVSDNGKTLVFERGGDLFTQPADGSSPARKINISVSQDYRFDPVEQTTQTKGASEMEVSPNGKQVLFGVRGELFVMPNDKDKKQVTRLTRHAWKDHDAHWLSDTSIVFLSDRTGNNELYLLQSADTAEVDLFKTLKWSLQRLTFTDAEESDLVLSPDRSQVAFIRGRGTLVVADIAANGLTNEKILLDGWATAEDVCWSPDGNWLAYTLADLDFNDEIYIHKVDGTQPPVNVSMHPRSDYAPYWSADGSKLGFLSIRNNGNADVWFAWLKQSDWEKTQQDWEWESDDTKDAKPDSIITVDTDKIYERLVQVTNLPGEEGDLVISPDGKTFFFSTNNGGRTGNEGDPAIQSIQWDGKESKVLAEKTRVRRMSIDKDGKKLYLLKSDGTVASLKIEGAKMEGLSFAARMEIDHVNERAQIIDDAWRALRDGFYDPQFHGQDWDALRNYYEPIAKNASTEQDFRDMFNAMLGQLNASHMGLFGRNPEDTQKDKTGLIGVEWQPVPEGVKATRILPGAPANKSNSQLEIGDVVTAVNGQPIGSTTNFFSLMNNTSGERTLLTVKNAAGSREVVIRPVSSLSDEVYEEWINERKRLTEQYSNGRLGYIHIQGMNCPALSGSSANSRPVAWAKRAS